MKTTLLRMSCAACIGLTALIGFKLKTKKPMPSPPEDTSQTVDGKTVSIHYNSPSMRGRKIFGVAGAVWQGVADGRESGDDAKDGSEFEDRNGDGAGGNLHALHAAFDGDWKLIINKQTGQWGTEVSPGPGPGARGHEEGDAVVAARGDVDHARAVPGKDELAACAVGDDGCVGAGGG